ncbi:pentapeptide repeat-containing protein [Streptomyces sp. ITFR-16]|uniref:pentapeptide repeat-containing protein n=1 Tax=Streptomyces sp. ITFR-16 TaxID=3075198 RepID=UPI0037DA180C
MVLEHEVRGHRLGDTRDRHRLLLAERADLAEARGRHVALALAGPRQRRCLPVEAVRLLRGHGQRRVRQRAHHLHDRKGDQQQEHQRGPDLDPAHDRADRGLRRRRGVRQLGQQVERRLGRHRLLPGPLGTAERGGGRRCGLLGPARRGRRPYVVGAQRYELAGPLGGGLGLRLRHGAGDLQRRGRLVDPGRPGRLEDGGRLVDALLVGGGGGVGGLGVGLGDIVGGLSVRLRRCLRLRFRVRLRIRVRLRVGLLAGVRNAGLFRGVVGRGGFGFRLGLRRVGLRALGLRGLGLRELGLRGLGLRALGLRGLRLRGLGLRGLRLRGLSLRGLGLRGLRLRGVGLRGVRLRGVRLRGVGLRGVRLRGVGLRGVRLRGVRLRGLGLRGLGLRGPGLVVALAGVALLTVAIGRRHPRGDRRTQPRVALLGLVRLGGGLHRLLGGRPGGRGALRGLLRLPGGLRSARGRLGGLHRAPRALRGLLRGGPGVRGTLRLPGIVVGSAVGCGIGNVGSFGVSRDGLVRRFLGRLRAGSLAGLAGRRHRDPGRAEPENGRLRVHTIAGLRRGGGFAEHREPRIVLAPSRSRRLLLLRLVGGLARHRCLLHAARGTPALSEPSTSVPCEPLAGLLDENDIPTGSRTKHPGTLDRQM